jgi:hypothetical protein
MKPKEMKGNKMNSKEIRTNKRHHKNPKEMRRNQKKYNAIDNGRKSREIKRIKKSKEIEANCERNDILTMSGSASLSNGDFILETERSFHVRLKLHKARRLLESQTRS